MLNGYKTLLVTKKKKRRKRQFFKIGWLCYFIISFSGEYAFSLEVKNVEILLPW